MATSAAVQLLPSTTQQQSRQLLIGAGRRPPGAFYFPCGSITALMMGWVPSMMLCMISRAWPKPNL